jgi:hypothetical protein
MSVRIDEQPRLYGLSIDSIDDATLSGLHSLLFLAAGGMYFGSVWLLSGLAPLPMLVSRLRNDRTENWRKTRA